VKKENRRFRRIILNGKIFVLDLKECVRIRTEERGPVAIG